MNSRVCSRCVMDESDPGIRFDARGVCNYCLEFDRRIGSYRFSPQEQRRRLDGMAALIRASGKNREYDCIIGISGGVDSSYTAYLACEMGLRPLVIHFDNGWDAEVAVSNIKKIVDTCGFDLQTYVIDWPEFRDLQRAFIRASVVDIEMVTDHAIFAAMFGFARRYGVRYVLSGNNFATEFGMPRTWLWRKQDAVNIRSIHRRYGTMRLRSFPMLGTFRLALIQKLGLGFTYLEPLNNMNYRKTDAMATLHSRYGWQYYGGKHYESLFTKFYQGYILPEKFGIDKRKAHYSALLRNGEVSRAEALAELEKPAYRSEELEIDRAYVLKKLGFSAEEFRRIMAEEPRPHTFYGSDETLYRLLHRVMTAAMRILPHKSGGR